MIVWLAVSGAYYLYHQFACDRVYGTFWDMVIEKDGKDAIKRSAERYLRAIAPSDG
jgi:hypothetical protein